MIFIVTLVILPMGFSIALSFFLGGLCCVIPNLFFAVRFFGKSGAIDARNILSGFYRAEITKLILTGAMFWLIFSFIPVTIMPIFVGFSIAQLAFWVSLILLSSKRAI